MKQKTGIRVLQKVSEKVKNKCQTNPLTLIGIVRGIKFYQHPHYGDCESLLAEIDGIFGYTGFYDLPYDYEF